MFIHAAAPRPARLATFIYADFTSTVSYLASVRQDRLLALGLAAPQWRAVEHRPGVPVTGIRLDGRGRAARERELAELRRLSNPGEIFDARVPGFIPSTRAASLVYAGVSEAGHGDRVRQLLFQAYWVQGADIGHPDVLARIVRSLLDDGALTIGDVTGAAARARVLDWQHAWARLGAPVDLTLVTPCTVSWGTAAVRALGAEPALAA